MTELESGLGPVAVTESTTSRIAITLRHAFAYGIGYSASTVTGLLLVPVYLRVLSTSEFGILALLTVTLGVVSEVFSLGVSSALFRSYFDYEEDEGRRNVVKTALVLVAVAAFILLFGGVLTAAWISHLLFNTERYAMALRLVFLIATLRLLRSIPFSIYRARQRSKEWASANLSFSLVKLTLTLGLLLGVDLRIVGVLLADLLAEALLCAYLFTRSSTDLAGRFRRAEAKKLLAYGLPLGLVGMLTLVISAADKYLLQAFAGPEEVGIYDLAQKFALLIMFFLITPFKLVWQPMSLEIMRRPGAQGYYAATLSGFLCVMAVALVGLSIFATDILGAVAPAPYQAAASVVFLLGLVMVIQGLLVFASFGLAVARRTDVLAIVNVVGAGANIGLNLLLIPQFGIKGAASASLFSWGVILFLDARLSSRHVSMPVEWIRVGAVIVAIVGSVLAGMVFDAAHFPLWLSLALKSSLTFAFAVLAALLLLGREHSRRLLRLRDLLRTAAVPISSGPGL